MEVIWVKAMMEVKISSLTSISPLLSISEVPITNSHLGQHSVAINTTSHPAA